MTGADNVVLLETGRPSHEEHHSYLFADPVDVITATTYEQVPAALDAIERLSRRHYLAGYCAYELGYAWEPTLRGGDLPEAPLIWMGVYDDVLAFDHKRDDPSRLNRRYFANEEYNLACNIKHLTFDLPYETYADRVETIRELIAKGDTYQVNFTSKYKFDFAGHPHALYQALKAKQAVAYNAYIKSGELSIVSASPELFFRRDGKHVFTKPMKGTMPRGRTISEDATMAATLCRDEKNRSENLMIVDLMRNDVGRISRTGSVTVPQLFLAEKYETLFQMTSTVQGELRPDITWPRFFESLFPSGSVTGAPKLRTMELIQKLEAEPRGVYTGGIGFVAPGERAVFNVPIRTVVIRGDRGEMGVGSGIVYDSSGPGEFEECRLKASFLVKPREEFSLIETMYWNGEIRNLRAHMNRLASSAAYFGFEYDQQAIGRRLEEFLSTIVNVSPHKVRLLLSRDGKVDFTAAPISEGVPDRATVCISGERTSSADTFLRHKTTKRELYNEEHGRAKRNGHFDTIFLNERGEVTEGAVSNIFVEKDGRYFTPPLGCGVLDGTFRRSFLSAHPDALEAVVTPEDLEHADAVYVSNAVVGMLPVEVVVSRTLFSSRQL